MRISEERLARLIAECASQRQPWCSWEEWERILTEPLPQGATETLFQMHDRPRIMLDLRDARAEAAAWQRVANQMLGALIEASGMDESARRVFAQACASEGVA